jgi:hypothetical protein
MRKVRRTLPIVLTAFAILVILTVAGHAGKPAPEKPVPTRVAVTGGIEGTGTPAAIRVTFADSSFAGACPGAPSFISNPDAPLTIIAAGGNSRTLMHCYCIHPDHLPNETVCNQIPSHYPYYYCLWIFGGAQQRKSTSGEVVFPAGSSWQINSKVPPPPGNDLYHGTLDSEVRYNVTR